jgi:hypothetical protein
MNQNENVKKVFDVLGFSEFFLSAKNIDEAKKLFNT